MTELKFFSHSQSLIKTFIQVSFLTGCAWFWFVILSNHELDPFAKTIAVTITAFGTYLVIYSIIELNKAYIDLGRAQLVNVKGTVISPKKHIYPFTSIEAIDVRLISSTNHDSDSQNKTVTTTYYAVLRLEDDEIYIEGSNNEEETKRHTKQLAKEMGKPYYVNYNAKDKSKAFSRSFNILRTLLLLAAVLAGMYGLFIYFSGQQV